jgi:hypothetical protein
LGQSFEGDRVVLGRVQLDWDLGLELASHIRCSVRLLLSEGQSKVRFLVSRSASSERDMGDVAKTLK